MVTSNDRADENAMEPYNVHSSRQSWSQDVTRQVALGDQETPRQGMDAEDIQQRVRSMIEAAMSTISLSMNDMDETKRMSYQDPFDDVKGEQNSASRVTDREVDLDRTVPRMHDAKFGINPTENIPGVENVHEELKAYNARLLETFTKDDSLALARQHRVTAEDLKLKAMDPMDEIDSIPVRIEFLNNLLRELESGEDRVRAAVASTVSVDVWGLRREILPWVSFMLEMGVRKFYLLYDGSDEEAVGYMKSIDCIELIHIHPPFATKDDEALWAVYSSTIHQWSGRPGNYELMVKQGYCQNEALKRASATLSQNSIDEQPTKPLHWMLHLDPDELIVSGDPGGTVVAELERVPSWIPSVRFMNFEAQYEAGRLDNRFEQATLFRVHKHFITPEAFAHRARYKLGNSSAFLNVYANGKSAVRIDAPDVRHSGPHFWRGSRSSRWESPENPSGNWVNAVSDRSVILHYAYAYEREVEAKAKRSCPDKYREIALSGDIARVKKDCFVVGLLHAAHSHSWVFQCLQNRKIIQFLF